MQLSTFYRIIAITLAALVFMSTSIQSMSVRYCGDSLTGIGLFAHDGESSDCCASVASDCDKSAREDCCKDEIIELVWDIDIAIHSASTIDIDADFVGVLCSIDSWSLHPSQSLSIPQTYMPPWLDEHRSVLFQQFLL